MSEAFFSLLVFVLLMVGTPGPANMLAMIGGARLGLAPCVGFIAGLTIGKVGVNVLFGVGLGLLLAEQAALLLALKLVSAAYLAWLAIQSWNPQVTDGQDSRKGLRFREGLIVHPLNPKAWVMSLLRGHNSRLIWGISGNRCSVCTTLRPVRYSPTQPGATSAP